MLINQLLIYLKCEFIEQLMPVYLPLYFSLVRIVLTTIKIHLPNNPL